MDNLYLQTVPPLSTGQHNGFTSGETAVGRDSAPKCGASLKTRTQILAIVMMTSRRKERSKNVDPARIRYQYCDEGAIAGAKASYCKYSTPLLYAIRFRNIYLDYRGYLSQRHNLSRERQCVKWIIIQILLLGHGELYSVATMALIPVLKDISQGD